MPRVTTPPATSAIRVIDPNAIFRLAELRAVLALPMTTLRREARAGRLRVSKRAGWYWVRGEWVHQWLNSGEVRRDAEGVAK